MSRHSSYLFASTLWMLAIVLLIFRSSFPSVDLHGPAAILALAVLLGTWVVYVSALTGSNALWRTSQAVNFAIPLVWALWLDNQANLMLSSAEWLALAMVSLLGNVAQNPWLYHAQLEDLVDKESVPESLLKAVEPVVTPLPILETGSIRIPRIPTMRIP